MVTALPRLVVSAPASGQGKTTVATGLMAALRAAGHEVSGHKVGPDYIDPGYHSLACGRPGRNLDPHLVGDQRLEPLLLHGARGADVAVVEGVMGLFDGRLGTDGFASTAHVAARTRTPVVLVVDCAKMSRSAAAIVHGMATFDDSVEVAGVILNRAGGARNIHEITRACRVPVLGALPRDAGLSTPSRHLGLVPAVERAQSVEVVQRWGEHVARHVDLDAVMAIASSAPAVTVEPWDPHQEVAPVAAQPVIAMATGAAFTFRYAETEELLLAAGCQVVGFDPLADSSLPSGVTGIYLGGGFPEVYAADLAANTSLLASLRAAVASGVPTVAECAGLLYLAQTLDGREMAGALPVHAAMSPRLTLGYSVAEAAGDSLLGRAGEQVSGHEFHRTVTDPPAGTNGFGAAWLLDRADGRAAEGFTTPTLHASYLHTHWAGHPHLAQRFADAAASAGPSAWPSVGQRQTKGSPGRPPRLTPAGDLRHHGDVEARGMVDFAVNVYAGPRPDWLDRALHESVAAAVAYPDPAPAVTALAKRHGREEAEVLPTAGAAEAFSLIARLRPWRRPVVVNPQFTEPQAALEQAGHRVTSVECRAADDFRLDPGLVPDDAELVVIGNPTNPTGVLHPAETIRTLQRPGRVLLVDEAFLDAVPGEPESLTGVRDAGLLVTRSLTKQWSIPGVRAGYLVGDSELVADLAKAQTPWSVSTAAIAAMLACSTDEAKCESERRAAQLTAWRDRLTDGLTALGVEFVGSVAPFVLARPGVAVHQALRDSGIAVRRADTFPGLDAEWVRIAVRPPKLTERLLTALSTVRPPH